MREAIILAGGFGTRLQGVISDVPKPMAPIGKRPFLEIVLRALQQNKTDRVILSLGFMAEKIMNHFGNNFHGMELIYVVEDTPLGTGGALRLAMSKCRYDHVFVMNGDTFLEVDFDALEAHWHRRHNPIIVGHEVSDVRRYGRLMIKSGFVQGFSEKNTSGSGLINAGCYVFNKNQFHHFQLNTPFSLERDGLLALLKETPVDIFITKGRFIDIGIPEDFLLAQSELIDLML